jgi:hypothetical protein
VAIVEPKKVLKEAEQVLAKAELVVKKLQDEKGGNSEKPAEKIEETTDAKQKK